MEAEPPDMRYQALPGHEYNHLGLLYVSTLQLCFGCGTAQSAYPVAPNCRVEGSVCPRARVLVQILDRFAAFGCHQPISAISRLVHLVNS